MKVFVLVLIILSISACGGSSSKQPQDGWVVGVHMPSRDYANRCITPLEHQDPVGDYVDENNWIRSWSHETYLWYDELPDIDPATVNNPIEYFNKMKTSAKTENGLPKDRFHYAENAQELNEYSETGVLVGYGVAISINKTPPRKAIIVYSEPDSIAAQNNIKRGTEITSVNGEMIADGNWNALSAGLFPSELGESHTFEIKDPNKLTRKVEIRSTQINEKPVHTDKVIMQDDQKIGYVLLNSFYIATAEKQLIDTIENFSKENIDELVLDLRYNGGGIISLSADLGAMIAGESAVGDVFTELTYNDKLSIENSIYNFSSTSSSNLTVAKGTRLPTLDLQRVYILSTNETASASEYLINGLRGIDFEVVLIGGKTTGKPYGWEDTENCGTIYSTIQFKGKNAKGFSDYIDGFVPSAEDNGRDQVSGCSVSDDLNHLLGDKNEKMLATALYHIKNNECPIGSHNSSGNPTLPLSADNGRIIRPYPTRLILQ